VRNLDRKQGIDDIGGRRKVLGVQHLAPSRVRFRTVRHSRAAAPQRGMHGGRAPGVGARQSRRTADRAHRYARQHTLLKRAMRKSTASSALPRLKTRPAAAPKDAGGSRGGAPSLSFDRKESCLRNSSRSARNESGDAPSFSAPRHLPSSSQMSLCRPVNKQPPDATHLEAIF